MNEPPLHVDRAAFRASTCSEITDAQLWLFAHDGDGVTFDGDDPSCVVLSTITGAHVPAALYCLACSANDWDALDAEGRATYFYRLETGSHAESRSMVRLP